jgi:hypothetical protein
MRELLFIYSGNTTFYAKLENGHPIYLLEYCSDIGVQLIKFLENESQTSPYSLLPGYEKANEFREHFKEWMNGLSCEGISYLDLERNKLKNPSIIELMELDDSFKKPYNIRHMVYHNKDGSFEIRTGYIIANLWDALYIELIKLVESGKLFKRCEHCKRIFFPKDRAEKYCDRWIEGNKTCKDVGYLYKVENDKFLKAYNTAYKSRHAEKQRKTRGKSQSTINKYIDEMNKWREAAKSGLQKVQNGEITFEEYKKILNKDLEANQNV